jgi:acetylornithine deacetylase/succinyl-diaminopimelate desuccinylase-like protein
MTIQRSSNATMSAPSAGQRLPEQVTAPMTANERDELERLLADLVGINSINPWITSEGPGEGEVAAFIASWLREIPGVEVHLDEAAPGRPNVLARISGTGDGPHLCFNVHTDTVACASWPDTAFVPRRRGDDLIGLGVADNKAQCAALMTLVRRLAANPPLGPVTAILAADEEGASIGARHLVRNFVADACINLEPHGIGQALVAHQGFGSFDLVVRAAAAHGVVDDAPDAGVQLASLIAGLAEIDREILATSVHDLTGKPFFHTSFIRGGTDWGTYPAELTLGFEMGTSPGQALSNRIDEIKEMIARVRETEHHALRAELIVQLENEPFVAAGHESLLAAYSAATEALIGLPAEAVGLNTWTDAAITQGAGIPTIGAGATGGNMHAIDEWVDVPSVSQLVEVLERTAHVYGAAAAPRVR